MHVHTVLLPLFRMYDRAPRAITKPFGSTAPGVGPGTYNPQDKNKPKGILANM